MIAHSYCRNDQSHHTKYDENQLMNFKFLPEKQLEMKRQMLATEHTKDML